MATLRFPRPRFRSASLSECTPFSVKTQPCRHEKRERAPSSRAPADDGHDRDRLVHRGVHVEVRQRRVDRGAIHRVQRMDIPISRYTGVVGRPGSARGMYVTRCRACTAGRRGLQGSPLCRVLAFSRSRVSRFHTLWRQLVL